MLQIKNLSAQAEQQPVLEDVSLTIKAGELHVLLGPNGSGKTSLAQVIMGSPRHQVRQGEIKFNQQEITQCKPEERAKLGLAMSFQDPPAIQGVTLKQLLELIADKSGGQAPDLNDELFNQAKHKLLNRDVNLKFSGGEKKIAEILQILALRPQLAIFDELDSGLDLKNTHKIADIIQKKLIEQGTAVLLITHTGKIIDGLKPDWTHVMLDKTIVCSSQDYLKVKQMIKEQGYEQCRHCQHRSKPE